MAVTSGESNDVEDAKLIWGRSGADEDLCISEMVGPEVEGSSGRRVTPPETRLLPPPLTLSDTC